jgi:hypothetical protein
MRMAKSAPSPSPSGQQTAGCAFETLARSPALHVQRCRHCNTLSLHVGALTLRFDAESAEAMWATLGEALLVLHARRQDEHEEQLRSLRSPRGLGGSERDPVN